MSRRVLVLHPSNEWYGADRMLAAWLEVLRERGWAASVVVPTDVVYSGELARRLEAMGCDVYAVDFPVLRRRELTPIGGLRLMRRLLASWRALRDLARSSDVVLLSTSAVLLGTLATLGTNSRRSIHVQEYVGDSLQGRALSWIIGALCNEVVCCSHAVRQGLWGQAAGKSKVLYNGVPDVAESSHQTPRGANSSQAPPYVLLVARIQRWKGQDMAIRMFAQPVLRDHPEQPVLRLIGAEPPGEEGVHLPLLRRLAQQLGISDRVELFGERHDIPAQISGATVVLNVSQLPDPFPLSALEAMRSGAAIVAGRLGGLPEMIGPAGILADPYSPVELAKAVARLLDSPDERACLGRQARERWASRFSSECHRRELTKLFLAWEG